MNNVITTRGVKCRVNKHIQKDLLEYKIRDIKVNGVVMGCSGFIKYKPTGKIIYINTEINFPCRATIGPRVTGQVFLLRYAKDMQNFTGDYNNYADVGCMGELLAHIFANKTKLLGKMA